MVETERLLSVSEAASRIGIHENTLRRWADLGLIHSVRRPDGTGHRKFLPSVVESLQEQYRTLGRRFPGGQPESVDEAVLHDIRRRNRVDYLDFTGSGTSCLLCEAFNGFADGKVVHHAGMTYYPSTTTDITRRHVHGAHLQVYEGQAFEDFNALREEIGRLMSSRPEWSGVLNQQLDRLGSGNPGEIGATQRDLEEVAISLIHIRRLAPGAL